MLAARESGAAIIFTYGAHLVKNGAGPMLSALIDAGLVTHLATQGAGIIHDWEFAFQGRSWRIGPRQYRRWHVRLLG